jgi:hypothetical protein
MSENLTSSRAALQCVCRPPRIDTRGRLLVQAREPQDPIAVTHSVWHRLPLIVVEEGRMEARSMVAKIPHVPVGVDLARLASSRVLLYELQMHRGLDPDVVLER